MSALWSDASLLVLRVPSARFTRLVSSYAKSLSTSSWPSVTYRYANAVLGLCANRETLSGLCAGNA